MIRRNFLLTFALLIAASAHAQEKLPKVLILGDSISIGYTDPVRKLLAGKAEVSRPNANCQHTAFGLANIDAWLGKTKWDVIHFNWGIWDTHMVDAQGRLKKDNDPGELRIRHTPEQYRDNLLQLVEKMQKTGAKLVFATTTPIMSRTGKRFEDIKVLNAVALDLMKRRDIAVNDLYDYVLPHAKEWQSGDKVHFTQAGNGELAKHVGASILKALEK